MVLSIPHPSKTKNREPSDRENYLLSLLSQSEFENLTANSTRVSLAPKTAIYQPGEPISEVYFPLKGIISLLNISQEGLMSEVITLAA